MSDVWCSRCDQPAEGEFRQPDGTTVALCHEHKLMAQWKAGNVNWWPTYRPDHTQPLTTSQHRRESYRRMK